MGSRWGCPVARGRGTRKCPRDNLGLHRHIQDRHREPALMCGVHPCQDGAGRHKQTHTAVLCIMQQVPTCARPPLLMPGRVRVKSSGKRLPPVTGLPRASRPTAPTRTVCQGFMLPMSRPISFLPKEQEWSQHLLSCRLIEMEAAIRMI